MKPVIPEVTAAVVEAPVIVEVAEPQSYTLHTLPGDIAMLTKARLTLLVLMTTAIGFAFGSSHGMDWFLFFRVMFGTAFVAASASVLNQFIERNVDRLMGRTKDRPLPAGRMYPGTALGLGVLLGVAGLIIMACLRAKPAQEAEVPRSRGCRVDAAEGRCQVRCLIRHAAYRAPGPDVFR